MGGAVGVVLSRAIACGVMEEKRRAARVAFEGRPLKLSGFDFLLRDCETKNLLLEWNGRCLVVVLGVGGEVKICAPPKKLEESKDLVVDAMDTTRFASILKLPQELGMEA